MEKNRSFWFVLLLVIVPYASAYDTGHHSDLTRNAMEIFGYNPNAQLVGAVSNWFVDYFSYTIGFEDIPDLNSLHFDNLYSLPNVTNYLTHLATNTRLTINNAAQQNDVLTYLSTMGATLHAIQDFYTHSSWTEHHPAGCGCYRDDTFFTALSAVGGNVTQLINEFSEIRTYSWGDNCGEFTRNCLPGQLPHGDYCEGINKDSYVRPWFERSYGHAFTGSIEWIFNLEKWALEVASDPNFVNNARAYSPSSSDLEDLNDDYEASIDVSYATTTPFSDDGHYKGSGSGSITRFASAEVEFLASSSIYKREFTDKQFWKTLTSPNLYDTAANANLAYSVAVEFVTPFSELPSNLALFRRVKVRTTYVKVNIGGVNTPSPYAVTNINGMEFEDTVQIDHDELFPHWTIIKFVPYNTTSVVIEYALWNDKFPTSDELINIASGDGKVNVVFDIGTQALSGDINGVFDTSSNSFNSSTDDALVSVFITAQEYGVCPPVPLPDAFCPDEAYTELLLHPYCASIFLDRERAKFIDQDRDFESSSPQNTIAFHYILFTFTVVIILSYIFSI